MIALLSVCLSCSSANQTASDKELMPALTKEEMLADYEAFATVWQQAIDSTAFSDSLISANRQLITDKLSYRHFYNIIWNTIDLCGTAESVSLKYPDSLRYLMADRKIYFPLPLRYQNGQIYTDILFKHMPAGTLILKINTLSAQDFVEQVTRYALIHETSPQQEHEYVSSNKLADYVYLSEGSQKLL